MKKIFVSIPVMTMLIAGFSYSTADARSTVGHLPNDTESNPTSEVKPEEEQKKEEAAENNNGSAVGHLPSNPESNLTSEIKPEEEPKKEEVAENNNGSAVGHLPSNPESNLTSEIKPEDEPESVPSIDSKMTILEAYAGENSIKVERPAVDVTLKFYRNNKYEGSGNIYSLFYETLGNRASFHYPGEALKLGDNLRVDTVDPSGLVTKGKRFKVSDMSTPEDKVTVNSLKAGKTVTIEGETMELATYYEIYVNGKPVKFTVKNKVNPDVYSVQVSDLNKGDIVTVFASDMNATGRYIHGSVTTTVE
ncbi:hypothetical protein ACQKGI_10290 [Peribacillus muralis]|uniref:hypothetical protein n=1 Tax=Peribacillus muralis TaxID=264697 RepID=UPI0038200B88